MPAGAVPNVIPDTSHPTLLGQQGGAITRAPTMKGGNGVGSAVHADGSIVLATDIGVYRYLADGTLDTAFQVAYNPTTIGAKFTGVTALADGKTLIHGYEWGADPSDGNYFLLRVNADGTAETGFGHGTGKSLIPMTGTQLVCDVVVLPDGKILLNGSSLDYATNARTLDVLRLLPDGTLDTTFGAGGRVELDGYFAGDMAVQADGRIVMAAHTTEHTDDWCLLRLNANGAPDTAFGNGSVVKTQFPLNSTSYQSGSVRAIAIQGDGKIIASGNTTMENQGAYNTVFAAVRYNADGSLDTGFGSGGRVTVDIRDTFEHDPAAFKFGGPVADAQQVKVLPNGQIMLAGRDSLLRWNEQETGDSAQHFSNLSHFAMARLNSNGSLDTTFGDGGQITTSLAGISNSAINMLHILADGSMVASGNTIVNLDSAVQFGAALARYHSDGSLDQSFAPPASVNTTLSMYRGAPAQVLAPGASVHKAGVPAADGGIGGYAGSSIVITRHGGANADDRYFASGDLAFSNGRVLLAAQDIGAVQMDGGTLHITFNDNATARRVNMAIEAISYANRSTQQGSETVLLDWTFSDGTHTSSIQTAVQLAPSPRALPYWVDALVYQQISGAEDSTTRDAMQTIIGADRTFKISFPAQVPAHWSDLSIIPFSAARQALVWQALDYTSRIVDLHFRPGDADSINSISLFDTGDNVAHGAATRPQAATSIGSDIALSFNEGEPDAQGSARTHVLMHELGHAIGLKHPFEYQSEGPYLPDTEAFIKWSQLAYYGVQSAEDAHAVAYSPLDIAALQYVYGPSRTARTGDDIYVLDETAPNFIWDGAGTDTISAAASSRNLVLHLDPGHWDSLGGEAATITAAGQVTVNFGSMIENATGGSGNDTITGTSGANVLKGNAGNDVLAGAGGNDTLDGGAGYDMAVLDGLRGSWTLTKTAGGILATGMAGTVQLAGVERVQFDNIALDVLSTYSDHALQVYKLYLAAFERVPDLGGLDYWTGALDRGASLADLAQQFMRSGEFVARYGSNHTHEQFVTMLYQHVLHRTPDGDGQAWWLAQLDNGTTSEAAMLAGFSTSAENQVQLTGLPTSWLG